MEGTLELIVFHPSCHRHYPRLLRSSLALDNARDGATTASLGNLCQGPTTLPGNYFFLISNLNLLSDSVRPLPLVLALQTLVKSLSASFLQAAFRHCKATMREPQSLLFWLNYPSSLSLPSQQNCSIPLMPLVSLLWPGSSSSLSLCRPRAGCSSPYTTVGSAWICGKNSECLSIVCHWLHTEVVESPFLESAPKNEYTWHFGTKASGYGDTELKVGLNDPGDV